MLPDTEIELLRLAAHGDKKVPAQYDRDSDK